MLKPSLIPTALALALASSVAPSGTAHAQTATQDAGATCARLCRHLTRTCGETRTCAARCQERVSGWTSPSRARYAQCMTALPCDDLTQTRATCQQLGRTADFPREAQALRVEDNSGYGLRLDALLLMKPDGRLYPATALLSAQKPAQAATQPKPNTPRYRLVEQIPASQLEPCTDAPSQPIASAAANRYRIVDVTYSLKRKRCAQPAPTPASPQADPALRPLLGMPDATCAARAETTAALSSNATVTFHTPHEQVTVEPGDTLIVRALDDLRCPNLPTTGATPLRVSVAAPDDRFVHVGTLAPGQRRLDLR